MSRHRAIAGGDRLEQHRLTHCVREHVAEHVDVLELGGESGANHVVRARHALDAVAAQVRMRLVGGEEDGIAGRKDNVVQQKGAEDANIARVLAVQAEGERLGGRGAAHFEPRNQPVQRCLQLLVWRAHHARVQLTECGTRLAAVLSAHVTRHLEGIDGSHANELDQLRAGVRIGQQICCRSKGAERLELTHGTGKLGLVVVVLVVLRVELVQSARLLLVWVRLDAERRPHREHLHEKGQRVLAIHCRAAPVPPLHPRAHLEHAILLCRHHCRSTWVCTNPHFSKGQRLVDPLHAAHGGKARHQGRGAHCAPAVVHDCAFDGQHPALGT